jgi:hypothetical protein
LTPNANRLQTDVCNAATRLKRSRFSYETLFRFYHYRFSFDKLFSSRLRAAADYNAADDGKVL